MQTYRYTYDKHAAKIRRHWLAQRRATRADKVKAILDEHLPSQAGEISLTELPYSHRHAGHRVRIARKLR